MLIALLSIVVGAMILSGLVTIYIDVPRQMGAQFRSYGANMLLLPEEGTGLTADSLQKALALIPEEAVVGATPYRYVRLDMPSRQQSFISAGTDFSQVQKTSPYFSVEGAYPENTREILVGKEIAQTLDVKEGTLVVAEKPSQYGYEYYKFTCEQVQNTTQYFAVRRIALYDKDGNRVGVGLSDDPPIADEMDGSWITKWHFNGELQPGYARWDMPSKFYKYTSGEKAATALAENESQARACMSANFTPAKTNYWPSIVWRLPKEEITPVTHVDIVQEVPVNSYRVGIFTLYGSSDGKAWKALKRVDLMEDDTPAGNWVSDGATVTNNAVRPGAGFALDSIGAHSSLPADATYDILTSASGVSVSSGATLKAEGNVVLRSLTVDCAAGNGTVDGFDFASSGTVNLVNLDTNRGVEVPFTLANLPEGALDRLNAEGEWSITVNGSPRSSWCVSFDGSSARAVPKGLLIMVK